METTLRVGRSFPPADRNETLHAAVVSSIREVRLVAVASSREKLRAHVADYVEHNAPTTLWPDDAKRVLSLLTLSRTEEAIQLYFERVGERWDREILHIDTVEAGVSSGRAARD